MRKRRCSVASFCQKSAFPCYVWAVEMSSGHTALILPLCVTQNVSSDSLTQLMFHGGTVISTFAAQLEDCQLQLFFSPILPLHLNFFFFAEPISICVWCDCKSSQMLVTVHAKPVGLTNALFFFFPSIHYSLLTVTPPRPIWCWQIHEQSGTKKKFVLDTWVKALQSLTNQTGKKSGKKKEKEGENLVWQTSPWWKPSHLLEAWKRNWN